MAKRTIIQALNDHFKTKPATDEEIAQLKKDLEREELKAKIREAKTRAKGGSGIEKFVKVSEQLFGKNEDIKTPRF